MKNSLKFNWNCWKRERKVEGETCLQSSRIRKYFIAFGNSILFASRWTLETLPDILLFIKIHKLWSMFDVKKFLKFPMILKKFIALSRCVLTFVVIKSPIFSMEMFPLRNEISIDFSYSTQGRRLVSPIIICLQN